MPMRTPQPEVVCSSFPKGAFPSTESFEAFAASLEEFAKGDYILRRTESYVSIYYLEDSAVERRLEDLRRAPR